MSCDHVFSFSGKLDVHDPSNVLECFDLFLTLEIAELIIRQAN